MLYEFKIIEAELTYIEALIHHCQRQHPVLLPVGVKESLILANELIALYPREPEDIYSFTDYEYERHKQFNNRQFQIYSEPIYDWLAEYVEEHQIDITSVVPAAASIPLLIDIDAIDTVPLSLAEQVYDALNWLSISPDRDAMFPGLNKDPSIFIKKHMPVLYEKIDALLCSSREISRLIKLHPSYSVGYGYGNMPFLNTPLGKISKLYEFV